ncbi:MAG: SOS response-associated peptidase [Bacteroidales bacterium]
MCYHYSIARTAEEIALHYNIKLKLKGVNPDPLFYHVNGFNFERLPVIYQDKTYSELKLDLIQWGMIPVWIKGEEEALKIRSMTLNARAETVDSKPAYRSAFRYRPCLVPATGYFEWMHYKGEKYPFYIFIPDRPVFSFAGIWEEWVNPDTGEILRSYSVVTCKANPLTAKIHNTKNRMPVILDSGSEIEWLDISAGRDDRKKLLKPYSAEEMSAYTVSKLITSRKDDSNRPEVLEHQSYPQLK